MSLLGSDKFGAKLSRIAALRPAKIRVPREFESIDESTPDPNDLTALLALPSREIPSANIFRFAAGSPLLSNVSKPAMRRLRARCVYCFLLPLRIPLQHPPRKQERIQLAHGLRNSHSIPRTGFFLIRKLPASPEAAARIHFWWASRGGTVAACRWNNFLCAISAKSTRCCFRCRSAWPNAACSSPTTEKALTGRFSKLVFE